ncbi:MAG: Protein SapB [Gemmatimonadaceae bacterium]|nr:Protein SapB [Gemmatimonadaceae bacterium]
MPGTTEVVVRLLMAALLGSAVGLERERLLWVAGLRTHMLVCVGSALVMLVSAFGFADVLGQPNVVLDPSRVAAQVVSGIGFLGAGTILLRNDVIHGLTTAASLWTVAAIGLAVGGGLYVPAVAATVLILLILVGLKPLENRLHADRRKLRSLRVEIDPSRIDRDAIEATLQRGSVKVRQMDSITSPNRDHRTLQFLLTADSSEELERLSDALRAMSGVIDTRVGQV